MSRGYEDILHPDVVSQVQTCMACPDQWEGRLYDGNYFYFRYRGGHAGLGVSVISVDEAASVNNETYTTLRVGAPLQGCFDSHEERQQVFGELLQTLRERIRNGPEEAAEEGREATEHPLCTD